MLNRFDIGKLSLLGALCAASAYPQNISIGAIAGAPFTDVVNSNAPLAVRGSATEPGLWCPWSL